MYLCKIVIEEQQCEFVYYIIYGKVEKKKKKYIPDITLGVRQSELLWKLN